MQIAEGLWTSGRGRCDRPPTQMPLPKPLDGFSANGIFRSQLPLRGSSGIAPDSLLGLGVVPGTAMDHKILCFYHIVNDMAAKWLLPIALHRVGDRSETGYNYSPPSHRAIYAPCMFHQNQSVKAANQGQACKV